jgi:hypothetical protein
MAMKNNKHIFAMSMWQSNVSKLSQNLQILNFKEIIKFSAQLNFFFKNSAKWKII